MKSILFFQPWIREEQQVVTSALCFLPDWTFRPITHHTDFPIILSGLHRLLLEFRGLCSVKMKTFVLRSVHKRQLHHILSLFRENRFFFCYLYIKFIIYIIIGKDSSNKTANIVDRWHIKLKFLHKNWKQSVPLKFSFGVFAILHKFPITRTMRN